MQCLVHSAAVLLKCRSTWESGLQENRKRTHRRHADTRTWVLAGGPGSGCAGCLKLQKFIDVEKAMVCKPISQESGFPYSLNLKMIDLRVLHAAFNYRWNLAIALIGLIIIFLSSSPHPLHHLNKPQRSDCFWIFPGTARLIR